MLPVALQLYSVRTDLEQDFEGTLARIHEMGYEGVEFAGLYGLSVEEITNLLEKYQLKAISAHVPFEEMMADAEDIFEQYAALGCKYIAVPYLTEEYRMNGPKEEEAFKDIHELGNLAQKFGLQLLYHNHDFEFVRTEEGEYGLDKLYRLIPAEMLMTEIDTCWVNVAGVNPVEYLMKYTNRAPVVHLKDFWMQGSAEGAYELIGQEKKATASKENFEFRPLGDGMQDVLALLTAAEQAGAEWIVVEQDEPSQGLSRMESVEHSIRYLRSR